jgi:ACS family hexuronate transporter-like MFS transporter
MSSSPATPAFKPGYYRWGICALLFFATSINYMDRQILSLLKPILDDQLHWTNEQFGWINSAFQGSYALSYLFFGWFVDKYGTKIGYAVSIAAWSVAAAAHALVNTIAGFAWARVALGLGEGGNFPAGIKSVAQWFPQKERALATTIFNSGANVGALLAPAIIPWLAIHYGWHSTFLAAGAAGFVWLVVWLKYFELPRRSPKLSATELDYIESGQITAPEVRPLSWGNIMGYRQTWGYLAARFLTDPVWWFFLIWLPDYFKKTQHMDIKTMGLPLIAIYATVTVLSIFAGWVSKRLVDQGWSITKTRKVSLLVFAVAVMPVVFATHVPIWVAVALIGLAGGAHQAWSATLYTSVSDVFPKSAIASLIGMGGLLGSVGGMIFPVVSGRVLDAFPEAGYGMLFGYCGGAYLLAFLINHLLVPKFEPIKVE